MDKALSLRFGRSSNIRDFDITLPREPDEPLTTRLARLQGKVYDQLYSPPGLSMPDDIRSQTAEGLAAESRELLHETHVEVFVSLLPLEPSPKKPCRQM
jgi:hypothetical protein